MMFCLKTLKNPVLLLDRNVSQTFTFGPAGRVDLSSSYKVLILDIADRKSPLTFRLPFVVNARPQVEQTNGFSPVCVRSWIWRALADEKFFLQALQLCCLGARRGGAGSRREVTPGLLTDG